MGVITRYLSDDGTTTGNKNANGDYSLAVEEWYYTATEDCELHRLLVSIEDAGGGTIQEYGNIGTALTNGIEVKLVNELDVVQYDLTDGLPIQTNGDWGSLCYDIDRKDWGNGNDFYQVRWTFSKSGVPLKLMTGWRLVAYLNDNLTGLVGHFFMTQGNS